MIKKKIITYFGYFIEYLKHGDLLSILWSFSYLVSNTSHHNDRVIRTSIGTFYCRKKTNDFQFANYKYEWGVKKYLLDNRDLYNVFIDGGACIGEYCVFLSGHNIRCIAFEPVMENFNILSKNLELNCLTGKVMAFAYGLGDKNEQAGFVFNPVNTGASRIAKNDHEKNCLVEIRTFDSLLPSLHLQKEDHILIKLDLEGMETEAIRGAAGFLKSYPHITLVLEDVHSGQDAIQRTLSDIGTFEFGIVDDFNIFAKKINPVSPN
jgi:FkbM family methyltransferase